MFERFTEGARGVVTGAVGHAERVEAELVTEEHMLLALLDQEGTRTSFAFACLGLTPTDRRSSMETALAEARRPPAVAGAGARARARGWSGRLRFAPGAKGTLEKSLRIAVGRGDRRVGGEHMLLALVARAGVVSEVLASHGATYAGVERAMFGGASARGAGAAY
ncbi:Clp protease N-terminal domain-containing protein [Streptomyces sp. NPDC087420]|uniref:Clp protease N-terminal domain-containing protein n=1 Tax=Streptomyces sp. NPDC087420 TaxID=3365785 RepID=UPI0038379356